MKIIKNWHLWLLGNLVKLPVDDHPADEHEEEDEAGRHPLELVVDSKVGVEVQHLSCQRQQARAVSGVRDEQDEQNEEEESEGTLVSSRTTFATFFSRLLGTKRSTSPRKSKIISRDIKDIGKGVRNEGHRRRSQGHQRFCGTTLTEPCIPVSWRRGIPNS